MKTNKQTKQIITKYKYTKNLRNKTYIVREVTSPLHQYNHDFELEPCDLEILQFCHDVDPFCMWFLSNLLNHVDGIGIVTSVPNG